MDVPHCFSIPFSCPSELHNFLHAFHDWVQCFHCKCPVITDLFLTDLSMSPTRRSLGEIEQRSTAIIICMSRYVKHGIRTEILTTPSESALALSASSILRLSHSHPWRHKPAFTLSPSGPSPSKTSTLNFESRPSRPSPSLKSEPMDDDPEFAVTHHAALRVLSS
ncbi:hypothetical protein BDP81DRAFT_160298 [Colletotrichum phormii]|uniref:Uncharacterized protein n=1 Tax=Colletotrichum phormii TaxID=359342 RepID=A0AAI9ZYL3_9PEZI|nr:uncharacterized protein BDP81DRAFT_160298 [Colletotrichum phormii]KAK1640251.1 hypothetical protein BDP81DRAFT_160298 [Colletotrichum phormii]